MPRYLYTFLELFGYLGRGTPDDPGTDFGMSVWIDAPDEDAAFRWGNRLLEDYRQARYRLAPGDEGEEGPGPEEPQHRHAARKLEGWIEKDESVLERARGCGYPECWVGEISEWIEPWRYNNARRDRRDGPQQG